MTTAALGPIARSTAADACTRALRDRIVGGAFAPGSKLPAERSLAADFGVNRVTVRAALATLAAEKLVDIRHGKGAVVADFLERGGPGLIAQIVAIAAGDVAVDACADLLEVRRALARVVVERVVLRIDDAGRGRIAAAVQTLARVVDDQEASGRADAVAVAAADLDVMRAIVAEAKSPVLALCTNPIAGVLIGLPRLCAAMFAEPARSVVAYQAFLDALADPEARPSLPAMMMALLAAHDGDTLAKLERRRRR